jgi:peptidoglycan/LPS O-acetylase OafA/YrhL
LLVAFVAWLETRRPLAHGHPLVTLGRASLSLLMLHVVLFREASRPIHWWRNLPAELALTVIFVFLALALVGSRLWQRVGYRYGAEWLLRKLAG